MKFSENIIDKLRMDKMITLYDFIKKLIIGSAVPSVALPSTEKIMLPNAASFRQEFNALMPATISKKDAVTLSDGIAKLVTDDAFLKELSETIHYPTKGETEDEFVNRCKRALFTLIDERLNSKA